MTSTEQTHNTPPVYAQVADMLIRDMAAGRLMDGERLPPEREMAARLEISVGTLRKALAVLEQKNLLRRVQGSGNYVESAGLRDTVYAMFRLELPGGGGLPHAQLLSVDVCPKLDLPRFGEAEEGTRIRRLRYLDSTPIAVEEIWLDAAQGTLHRDQVGPSLYRTYQEVLQLWITRAEDRVTLGPLPAWTPREFDLAPGTVVGFIERRSWADRHAAVEFSRTWYDPARAVYVQRIK